jgi:Ser/Thr protein kinase RdoA (MazF antagonist)
VLLDDIPGEDQYDASAERCAHMVRRWVDVQSRWSGGVDDLPDWRPPSFISMIERLVDRPELEALVAQLANRFAMLAECGLPDTFVHGDFHPGNWRGDDEALVLLDWGDSGIGHPLLDQPAFLHGNLMTQEKRAAARVAWREAWHDARPDADPDRAAELIAPVAALRAAHIFRVFLDNIEPSEHCYHKHDTEDWLQRALALAH